MKKRLSHQSYWIIFAVTLLLFFLSYFRIVDFQELRAVDLRFLLRGKQAAHPDLVIVEIDDASIQAVGQWPWPRSIHAVLIDLLMNYKPRLIFLDMLFTEAGQNPIDDEKLSYVVERAANVVLPFYYHSVKPFGAFFPLPKFRDAARALGFVNIEPDSDGHMRRMPVSVEGADRKFYSIPVSLRLAGFLNEEDARDWLAKIPRDRQGTFWINFPGPIDSFKRISFGEVINSAGTDKEGEMRALFENRIVLVGFTATGSTTDLKPVAFSPAYPGTGVIASALHTLLTGRYLYSVNGFVTLLILLLAAMLTVLSTEVCRPRRGLLLTGLLAAGYAVLNYCAFVFLGWILPLFTVLLVVGLSYVLTLFMQFIEIYLEGELLSRELSTAARIQETFLPRERPEIETLDVAFECRFAKRVGGDLYDWTDMGDGRLGVLVGDVAGKGVPAAIYMARTVSDFRSQMKAMETPGALFSQVNNLLVNHGTAGMFVTMVYVAADTGRRKIAISNAGHENVILYRHGQIRAEVIDLAKGPPLGVFEGAPYETAELAFKEGDLFILLSDGVKELRDKKGREFGTEKIRNLVEENGAFLSSEDMIRMLFEEMERHRRGRLPHDDRTLLCVKFRAPLR